MDRRNILRTLGGAGAGLLASAGPLAQAQDTARRGLPPLKITDNRTILTQPAGDHLVIVKVLTNEPGLYGVGCATHRERPLAVAAYVDNYLKPFLVGRNCDEIEDIWQSTYLQSYFRSGVTGNNALSGVDGALWDILGKRCGVPVYKLLGGKVRAAVPLYTHAAAREFSQLEDQIQKFRAEGYRYIRVQLAVPGYSGYGVAAQTAEDGHQGAQADGGRDELLPANEEQLAEVREVDFPRVMLQVSVGEKRNGGIEDGCRRKHLFAVRIKEFGPVRL